MTAAQVLWDYHRLGRPVGPVDAIIGLGSYDLRVADRCAHLWKDGIAPFIVFSGARGNWTQGFDETEAALFGARAQALGVPPQAVFSEDRSTNLGQNIALSRELLGGMGLPIKRLLLVTKPNTERRAWATAVRVWPEVEWTITSPDSSLEGPYALGRGLQDLIDEMVGDLERILRYPALGFQVPLEVPDLVLAAFEELKAAGHTRHLMKS